VTCICKYWEKGDSTMEDLVYVDYHLGEEIILIKAPKGLGKSLLNAGKATLPHDENTAPMAEAMIRSREPERRPSGRYHAKMKTKK
jgi:hypothetical protein